ncbi:MAG: HlyD family secretion protein, partial [Methylococcales bacterium]|nr:HlyD family secretion protein [Methylococcales bacterium]
PTTFEFSLGQSQADLTANQSSLKQLQVEETSARKSLSIAKKNLATGKKELARITSVWEKKLISRSAVDAEEQKVLQLQQTVEDLQGKLNSFASRKAANQAQITKSETVLEQSKDTLGRTEVVLPFDARVGTVDIENGEFVTVGATLFEALGTQSVEINAQLPVKHFRPLLLGLGKDAVNLQGSKLLQRQVDQFKISAHINLVGFNNEHANWKGKLIRIGESIDPDRDTIGLVVKVDNPYQNVIPGIRPPLLKGMYAAVEFFTPAHKMLVIPRKALHQGRVYVALDNNQLEIRPVTVLYKQGEMVVIKSGIKEGEKIIITDVTPVINGLPLNLVFAADAEQALATSALGGEL